MANQYETYLQRLRSIKQTKPEMKVYERNLQAMSQPFNLMNRQVASMTQRGGASTASQVAALTEGRNAWNSMQSENYNIAVNAASQREGALDTKIAEVEFANQQQNEQDAKDKAAKKTDALRMVAQIVGGGIGFAVGGLPGAAIGASIGQTAGGFMGIDKDGKPTVKPEDWDVEMIGQGLASTAQGLAYNANKNSTKGKLNLLSGKANEISSYLSANPDGAATFQFQLENFLRNGSVSDLDNWLNNLMSGGGGSVTPIQRTDLD